MAAAAEVRESFVTAFSDLAETVPEELRDDVSTMRDALVPLLDAAADNDYEQFTEVMEDIAQDGGEAVQSASIEVNNYSQEQCGFVLDE